MRTVRCVVCGSTVLWTITQGGKCLAVDVGPAPGGNTAVYRDGLGVWSSRRPSAELPIAKWAQLYMPYAASYRAHRPVPVPAAGVADLGAYRRRRGRQM